MPDDAYRLLIVSVLSGSLGGARDGGGSPCGGMQVVTSRVGEEKATARGRQFTREGDE